ncbi:MAG: HD domain-containing protein [Spirochaetia bacterium]|jgi:HD-GYP domain-containing protein (c-di-GMP phosphodiesterase class II)|nr:HD domain-containing protein [Spirochaetia bacterium]
MNTSRPDTGVHETGKGQKSINQDLSEKDFMLKDLQAIALENYEKIRKLEDQFEDFVSASVKIIESRDPVTRGHSLRVASLCRKIAEDMGLEYNQMKTLEYAALLHDFGKVSINPEVQYKKKNLHAHDKERIDLTLDYLYRYQELCYSRHEIRLHNMPDLKSDSFTFLIKELHQERDEILGSIREAKNMVDRYSDPGFTSENSEKELNQMVRKLHTLRCLDIHDKPFLPFRTADLYNLSIVTGTLNAREEDLREHVVRTYQFLKDLTWPEHLREVPEICLLHKERLDGSGYPSGLKGEDISILSRILAVANMYDELITKDRAYGKVSSNAPIMEMLIGQAEEGLLDRAVVLTLRNLTGSDY